MQSWSLKRKRSTWVFGFQYFIIAVEISISFSTTWIYIKEIIGKDNKDLPLYYAILNAATFLPAVLLSSLCGVLADKTRKTKLLLCFGNFTSLVGCILYVIPGSVWFPITGQFFIGCNAVMRPVMTGEVIRAFELEDLTQTMKLLRFSYVFGMAAGPVIVTVFLNTRFRIGNVEIRYANISSIVLFSLIFLSTFFVLCFVSDLSREYDMKMEQSKVKLIDNLNSNDITENMELLDTSYTTTKVFLKALKYPDFYLVMVCNWFKSCSAMTLALAIPAHMLNALYYAKVYVNLVVSCQIVFFLLIFLIITISKLNHVDCVLLSFIGFIVSALFVVISTPHNKYWINLIMLMISWSLQEIFRLCVNVYTSIGLANMFSSPYQSFMDGVRIQVSFFGNFCGCMLAAIAIEYLEKTCISFMALSAFLFCIVLYRRNSFLKESINIA